MCAGALADNDYVWWPGLVGGAASAALAGAATQSLLVRTRARLDAEAQGALPVYLEGAALLLATLAVITAFVTIFALGFFAEFLRRSRRRAGEKYAGLRILR